LIVTVTMNTAIDRVLTVPNFQLGHRHRATQGLMLAGGKGIAIARALKLLAVPVVATGFAGGRSGRRIVEELTSEAVLNDFVRIADESRTSTTVVDPARGTFTEINEWGPHVEPDELEQLTSKLHYLARDADLVVFAGSLPRGLADDVYAEAVRDLHRRGVDSALATAGEAVRYGLEAEPFLVSLQQDEAEALVGLEFRDEADFVQALEDVADLGARSVLITEPTGCYALLRDKRRVRRLHAVGSDLDTPAASGVADVVLAAFLAGHLEGRAHDENLRAAVATAAASGLELGAGRFDPKEVGRLAQRVTVSELEPVKLEG
jgi:1-phosphofructokinase/tagatose 6-phosphate kinase